MVAMDGVRACERGLGSALTADNEAIDEKSIALASPTVAKEHSLPAMHSFTVAASKSKYQCVFMVCESSKYSKTMMSRFFRQVKYGCV